jgi:hypothetical protein
VNRGIYNFLCQIIFILCVSGSVARIICVAVATLANEKLLERASDYDFLLCRKSSRIKCVIDNDLIDV